MYDMYLNKIHSIHLS